MYKICLFMLCLFGVGKINSQMYSTKVGTNALVNENGGGSNSAFGHYTLFNTVTSWTNNAQGAWAMYFNDYGQVNSAFGSSALFFNTSGFENTVLGFRSMFTNPNGYQNTSVGSEAMFNSGVYNSINGSLNTAIGTRALYSNYGGNYNVAIGDQAGFLTANGSNNTFVGVQADANGSYTNSAALGAYSTVTGDNMIVIGNSSVSLIGGRVNWSTLSDRRTKKNIEKHVPGLKFINGLQPVSYNYDIDSYEKLIRPNKKNGVVSNQGDPLTFLREAKQKKESKKYVGLLAQDVEAAAKKIGYPFSGIDIPSNDSSAYGLKYAELVPPLVKSIQELSSLNDSLKMELDELAKELNDLIVRQNNDEPKEFIARTSQSNLYQSIPTQFKHSSIINYKLKNSAKSAVIKIYDTNNKVVKSFNLNPDQKNGEIQITVDQLSLGKYSYSLEVDGSFISKKYFYIIK